MQGCFLRITQVFKDFYNGQVLGDSKFMNPQEYPEDLQRLYAAEQQASQT